MNNKFIATMLFSALILCTLSFSTVALALTAPDWSVTLTATTSPYTAQATFGSSPLSVPGWDPNYDNLIAPGSPVGVSSWFYFPSNPTTPVNEQKLLISILPTTSGATWDYQIRATGVSGTTTVTWTTASVIPSGFNVYLMDTTGTTQLADLRTATQYQFTAAEDQTYDFKVVLAPASQLPEYPIGALAAIGASIAALLVYKRKSLPHLNLHI